MTISFTPYAMESDADAYFAAIGSVPDSWTAASEADRGFALVAGTRYLDAHYGQRWKGYRSDPDQVQDWPRHSVVTRDGFVLDPDTIPQAVQIAAIEAAIIHLDGGLLVPTSAASTKSIKRERNKLGPMEEEVEYSGSGKVGPGDPGATAYPHIEWGLRDLLQSASGQSALVFPFQSGSTQAVDPWTQRIPPPFG